MKSNLPKRRPAAMRSIEAAAAAGLACSVLTTTAWLILARAPDPSAGDVTLADWYLKASNQRLTLTALNLAAVGTIAFLWLVAVIRRRVGTRENRFFGTVFFGSALLVAGAWLAGAMLQAAPAMSVYLFGIKPSVSEVALTRAAASIMLVVVATRLEAVFVLTTTTVGRLSKVFPRWLVVLGYLLGLALLLSFFPQPALTLFFPGWAAVVSLVLLIRRNVLEEDNHQPPDPASGPRL